MSSLRNQAVLSARHMNEPGDRQEYRQPRGNLLSRPCRLRTFNLFQCLTPLANPPNPLSCPTINHLASSTAFFSLVADWLVSSHLCWRSISRRGAGHAWLLDPSDFPFPGLHLRPQGRAGSDKPCQTLLVSCTFTTSPLFPLAPCRRSASDPRSGRPRRKPRNVPRDSREDGLGVIPASKLVLWPCRTALHLSQIGECSTARASRQKDAKGKRKGSHLVMGKTYTLCSETILPRAYDPGWTGERKKTYSSRPNPLPL
jgi:hypothetical protein